MFPNRIPEFPYLYLQYLTMSAKASSIAPMWLGGTSGSGGGVGGPVGGVIGKMPQSLVTYDTDEFSYTTGSGSLVDNLAHIRHQIAAVVAVASGVSGTGAVRQVAFWTSGSVIGGNSNFLWDTPTTQLTIPHLSVTSGSILMGGKRFQIDTQFEFDGTSATSGSFLGFNGNKWIPMMVTSGSSSISGTGANGQVAYWSSASAITGDSGLQWDGHTLSVTSIRTSIVNPAMYVAPAAYSAANSEIIDVYFLFGRTSTFTHGSAPATQRAFFIEAPSYNNSSLTDTITNAATVAIQGAPIALGGLAMTNAYALWIQSGTTRLDGVFKLGANTLTLDAPIELDPTSAISGQFLKYNGVKWIPAAGGGSTDFLVVQVFS